MDDAVEGQRRLVERELGDVRANQGRLDRDDRSGTESEEPTGAGGVKHSAQVFDLGIQPVKLPVRSAQASATPRYRRPWQPGPRWRSPGGRAA